MEIYADMEDYPITDNEQAQLTQSTQAPLVKDDILKIIREYNKTSGFTDRKLTDTPTDALAVVNRKFVTGNGTTANRPPNPVQGQYYLDLSLNANGIPIWYGPNGWTNSVGILV